jgi:hypothetical protein
MYHKAQQRPSRRSAVGEGGERTADRPVWVREHADALGEIAARDPLEIVEARYARFPKTDLFVEWDLGRDVSNRSRDRSHEDGVQHGYGMRARYDKDGSSFALFRLRPPDLTLGGRHHGSSSIIRLAA